MRQTVTDVELMREALKALGGFEEDNTGHSFGCIMNRLSGEEIADMDVSCDLYCRRAAAAITKLEQRLLNE